MAAAIGSANWSSRWSTSRRRSAATSRRSQRVNCTRPVRSCSQMPMEPVALFVFGERLRDDAASLIDTVAERGVEPILISGDRRAPVHAVAASLGIERALAHQTPHSKCEWVVGQRRAGHKVAMLGDGINDAPALARADVSIALADGSATAQARADLIVQSSRLADIEYAFTVARQRCAWRIRILAWPSVAT